MYQESLYYHIRGFVCDHEDTDDVLQNTFIKAWKGIDGFRGESKLKTWMFRIATNESITFLTRKKKRQFTELSDIENNLSHSNGEIDQMDGDTIRMKLEQAIETLPDKQRLVFNLKYFEEMKYDGMAQVLGGSVGSLKASYHHAVKKIENFLTKD